MPRKLYWTYERCKEVALLCDKRCIFAEKYIGAYKSSIKYGWLDELCSHMISTQNPDGYWTYERCKEESLKYDNKAIFRKKSRASFEKSHLKGWLNELCSHMICHKTNGYWNYERCKEESSKYEYKYDFAKQSVSAYNSCLSNGWLDNLCSHMKSKGNNQFRHIYVYEFLETNVAYVGLTYNTEMNIFRHEKNGKYKSHKNIISPVYKYIKENPDVKYIRKQLTEYVNEDKAKILEYEWLEKYKKDGWFVLNSVKAGGLGGTKLIWTYEKCKDISMSCNSKTEFRKKSTSAWNSTIKHGWLDELCYHMTHEQKKPNGYWNYERCKEESLKYDNKQEFRKNGTGAHNSIFKNKWFDLYSHMKQKIK